MPTAVPIDPSTGLPQLSSADLFWRVRHDHVEIMRKPKNDEWVECRMIYTDPDLPFNRCRICGLNPLYELKTEREFRETIVVHRGWFGSEREEKVKRLAAVKYHRKLPSVVYSYEPLESITPESLFRVCAEALACWQRSEATKALLGDYPPQRFDTPKQSTNTMKEAAK